MLRVPSLGSNWRPSAVVALRLSGQVELPQNSGILVATDADLTAKAFTLSSRKWTHLADRGEHLVRVSFGRFGASEIVDRPDGELIDFARADLETVTGITEEPGATFVQRWHGGLPQYAPGHTEIVAEIESGMTQFDGLALAGSWLHGVGVPAVCRSRHDGGYTDIRASGTIDPWHVLISTN